MAKIDTRNEGRQTTFRREGDFALWIVARAGTGTDSEFWIQFQVDSAARRDKAIRATLTREEAEIVRDRLTALLARED